MGQEFNYSLGADAPVRDAGGEAKEPGAYFYNIKTAEVKQGGKGDYIELSLEAKGVDDTSMKVDMKFVKFFPNSEAMKGIFNGLLLTLNLKNGMKNTDDLVGKQGILVAQNEEQMSKGEVKPFLIPISFFSLKKLSGSEIKKGVTEPKKFLEELEYVAKHPLKKLSGSSGGGGSVDPTYDQADDDDETQDLPF